MPLVEIIVSPRHTVLPVLLVVLYMGGCVLSCVNTGIFYQNHKDIIPPVLVSGHLAFCVVGFVGFFCVSALLWLWSAKYSYTRSGRTWRLFLGIWVVSLCKDLPLFVIESMTVARTGWWAASTLQGACYIVQIVYFVISITVTGMSYSWYASGLLERCWGAQMMLEMGPRSEKIFQTPFEATSPPPVMLRDSTSPRHYYYGDVGDGGGGESPLPTPQRRPTTYEANYARLNSMNPVEENMFFSGPRVQTVERSADIPPAQI